MLAYEYAREKSFFIKDTCDLKNQINDHIFETYTPSNWIAKILYKLRKTTYEVFYDSKQCDCKITLKLYCDRFQDTFCLTATNSNFDNARYDYINEKNLYVKERSSGWNNNSKFYIQFLGNSILVLTKSYRLIYFKLKLRKTFKQKLNHSVKRLSSINLAKQQDQTDILNFGFLNEKTIFVFTKQTFAIVSLTSRKVISKISQKTNYLIDYFVINQNKNEPSKNLSEKKLRLILVFDSCLKNSDARGINTCLCCYDIFLPENQSDLQQDPKEVIKHKWVHFIDSVLDKISLLNSKNLYALKQNLSGTYDKSQKFMDVEKGEIIKSLAFEKTIKFINEFAIFSNKNNSKIIKEFCYDTKLEIKKGQNTPCNAMSMTVGIDTKNCPMIVVYSDKIKLKEIPGQKVFFSSWRLNKYLS